jgi:threonine/homoserine/homoserine lactone efflux protein
VTLEAWLLFCATDTVLSLTPGPAVLLVVSLALTRGARPGLRASLGVLCANALYFTISATGIGALLLASWHVFFAVKWLGAAYLVWTGLAMLLRRPSAEETLVPVRGGGFRGGFLVSGSNPKNLVYFAAILPQFIDPSETTIPFACQVAILAVTSMTIELGTLAGYALLAARGRRLVGTPRARAWLHRSGGALLIAAAARVAASRRGEVPAGALP